MLQNVVLHLLMVKMMEAYKNLRKLKIFFLKKNILKLHSILYLGIARLPINFQKINAGMYVGAIIVMLVLQKF